ncbi:MAG: DNA cytosine methyltransferase [Chloroflexi bacterium]|nr:DNA cytosine methyltransferase [Chloroflexota bacterium]MCY3939236.1 DNA cytosine methyltransferase [Chloroflexota bacterium]
MSSQAVKEFLEKTRPESTGDRTAVSLFSGAGLSDLGYEMAGFQFVVQVEVDERRAAIGADNFPESTWIPDDVCTNHEEIAEAYRAATSDPLDLLVATPPCQGMSSSNPSRGKRRTSKAEALEEKNRLILEVIPIAELLKPKIIVAENVRQVLTLEVEYDGTRGQIVDLLRDGLSDYQVFADVVNVADYGIPQIRRRAFVVAVHKEEQWLESATLQNVNPWPSPTHSELSNNGVPRWVSIQEWFKSMQYEHLNAKSKDTARGKHPLHYVPAYASDRYLQVSEIPAHSGQSAYENDTCPSCRHSPVELGTVSCPKCSGVMRNRPYVERDGQPSLIKGFKSSYRRMSPNRPAYTVTTNSSHVGSDFKIHPWENRVLSILECADLQTVPRFYDWTRAQEDRTFYLIRNLIGEAFPTYFTYLHGRFLDNLLAGQG